MPRRGVREEAEQLAVARKLLGALEWHPALAGVVEDFDAGDLEGCVREGRRTLCAGDLVEVRLHSVEEMVHIGHGRKGEARVALRTKQVARNTHAEAVSPLSPRLRAWQSVLREVPIEVELCPVPA